MDASLGMPNPTAGSVFPYVQHILVYRLSQEYLDMDRVKKVDLYENGTIAIVEAVSPELGNRVQRVRVQLPGTSSELLQKFRNKNVDFAAHTEDEDGGQVFMNLLVSFSLH